MYIESNKKTESDSLYVYTCLANKVYSIIHSHLRTLTHLLANLESDSYNYFTLTKLGLINQA